MILFEEFAFPLEDGTGEILDKDEKEKEDNYKEVNKALDKVGKLVDGINKDPVGKEHKLTLPEPNEDLNEEFEQDLEEALPKDLAGAFRNFTPIKTKEHGEIYSRSGGYKDIDNRYKRSAVDFNNADYRVATPEEIFQLKKDGQLDKALIVFDGKLVTFSPEGRQITKAERDYKTINRDVYVNDNTGELTYSSKELPFKQMVQKADKLYVIENEPLVDPQLRADRSTNPESRYYNPSVGYHDMYGQEDVLGKSTRGFSNWSGALKDNPRNRNSHSRLTKVVADRDSRINNYAELRDRETPGSYNYDYYNRVIDTAKEERTKAINDYHDSAAAIRNADANMALKKPLRTYRDLKRQLDDDKNRLARSQTNLANAQQNGSPATRTTRVDLEQAYNELKRLRRRIMELEDQLDGADLTDSAEVKKYQDAVNDYTSKIANTQADLDKLLRRNKP